MLSSLSGILFPLHRHATTFSLISNPSLTPSRPPLLLLHRLPLPLLPWDVADGEKVSGGWEMAGTGVATTGWERLRSSVVMSMVGGLLDPWWWRPLWWPSLGHDPAVMTTKRRWTRLRQRWCSIPSPMFCYCCVLPCRSTGRFTPYFASGGGGRHGGGGGVNPFHYLICWLSFSFCRFPGKVIFLLFLSYSCSR